MAFPDSIVLKDRLNANVTFQRTSASETKALYIDANSSLATPTTLMIAKTPAKNADGTDRYVTKVTKTVLDGVSGKSRPVSHSSADSIPRLGVARTDVDDVVAMVNSFNTVANYDRKVRGEI